MFLTFTPMHYDVRLNESMQHANCSIIQRPLTIEQVANMEWAVDAVKTRKAQIKVFRHDPEFKIIDITNLALYRADAHLQSYFDVEGGIDCLHWCIPDQAELAVESQTTPEQQSEPEKPSEPKPERETAVSPSTTCDLTVGSWVANPSRQPQYTGESCRSLSRALNCQRNGWVNMRYLQYEWRSPGCRIERFDASAFLERMRNKVFLVVGDSLTLNFFSALQCLVETVTPTKVCCTVQSSPSPLSPFMSPLSLLVSVSPFQHMDCASGPEQHMDCASGPEQHMDCASGPEQHMDCASGPEQHMDCASGPEQHMDCASGPEQHMDCASGPEQHMDCASGPEQHMDCASGPEQHMDCASGPEQHMDCASGPEQHMDCASGPEQHMDCASGPEQHMDCASGPEQHMDCASGPEQHMDCASGPEQHMDCASGPEQHMDCASGPEQHMDCASGPEQHMDCASGPEQHMDCASGPEQHMDCASGPEQHMDCASGPEQHMDCASGPEQHMDCASGPEQHMDCASGPEQHMDCASGPEQHMDCASGPEQHMDCASGPEQHMDSLSSLPSTGRQDQCKHIVGASESGGGDRTSSASTWTVHLDQVHPEWAAVLQYTDYVVFGVGAWFTTGRVKTRHYMINNTEQPNNRIATMQAALRTVTRFTRSINYTGVPIFLTYSPMHGNVRVNSTAPSLGCSAYMDPVKPDAVEVPQWNKDCIGVRNAQIELVRQLKEFKVVDVTALSVLRPDGHLQDHSERVTETNSASTAAEGKAEFAGESRPTPEQQSEPEAPSEPKPEGETAVSPSTTCDLTVGSWVANPSRQPQYTGESCKSLSRQFNCQRNGRVNMRYLQYEWRSPGCRIERFNASAFLERMRNKVFMVVGDSLSMNFFAALQCLIETATQTKSRDGPLFPGGPRTRAVIAPRFNATFLSHASSFLVKSIPSGAPSTASTWTVHLDQVHPNWSPVVQYSDYAIFGIGAWYTIANLKKRHYMLGNKEQPSQDRLATMQALHTVARFTRSINYTGIPMLLTYSPVHVKVRVNSTAPELGCSSYMRPVGMEALEGAQWATDAMAARYAQIDVLRQYKEFKVVDVTPLSVLRPDGHLQNHCESPKGLDCLHWCLPGIPDTWSDILYSHVMEYI
ncbi:unnamed protein product [Closterium sp. Yama58-4]|nr:unnamed protein product [Closterium sp. Yama58-4]